MLADALAQYLVWKQWKRWLFVVGSHEPDKLYADALRRAATRFGAKIVQERTFEDTGGARRTDSGVTLIQRQMPVFTQQAPAYDVLVAADESEVFASYLPYRTWDPRPVAAYTYSPRFCRQRTASRVPWTTLVNSTAGWVSPERSRSNGVPRCQLRSSRWF